MNRRVFSAGFLSIVLPAKPFEAPPPQPQFGWLVDDRMARKNGWDVMKCKALIAMPGVIILQKGDNE